MLITVTVEPESNSDEEQSHDSWRNKSSNRQRNDSTWTPKEKEPANAANKKQRGRPKRNVDSTIANNTDVIVDTVSSNGRRVVTRARAKRRCMCYIKCSNKYINELQRNVNNRR